MTLRGGKLLQSQTPALNLATTPYLSAKQGNNLGNLSRKSPVTQEPDQLLKKLKFSFKCNFHRHFNKDWISSGDLGGNWPFGHPEALTSQTAHIYQPKWICQVGNLISINASFTTDQAA